MSDQAWQMSVFRIGFVQKIEFGRILVRGRTGKSRQDAVCVKTRTTKKPASILESFRNGF
jgi:hypothetical protein